MGNKEARTPNIDALVKQGVVMDRQCACPTRCGGRERGPSADPAAGRADTFKYCSPTRSSFLSGRLPYHVNQANRAYSAVGGVDLRMTILPEHLKKAGCKRDVRCCARGCGLANPGSAAVRWDAPDRQGNHPHALLPVPSLSNPLTLSLFSQWHAGSSCEANLPVKRGFDTSYGYLGGSEGHYNQQ
eukprot:COSAG04_NODE_1274_length_7465_cov_4.194542_1_plen_186_part_00